ncbi:MAG TPA: VanZ family protein [Elusimicrobiota bacterium]|nr:VanZ family protein [Elusimicrobiota bacterium]
MSEPAISKNKANRWLGLWIPPLLWCGVIFYFSGIPDLSTGWGMWDLVFRKAAHAAEFGILAALLWRALEHTFSWTLSRIFWVCVSFSILYAASDEWHQGFIPGRVPSAWDAGIDALGALLVCRWQRRWGMNLFAKLSPFYTRPGRVALALSFLGVLGCGRLGFFKAERLEKAGRFEEALRAYVAVADQVPSGAIAPKALYAAGRLAGRTLQDYELARGLFQRLIDQHGDRKGWGDKAERAIFNTPNYFPLVVNGQWEEGDSDTGGRNAKIRIVCRVADDDPAAVLMTHNFYAGDKFQKNLSIRKRYKKEKLELREYLNDKSAPTVILKYPFEKGSRWTSRRDGRNFIFTVDGMAAVKVRAGEFRDCLVVREQMEGITGSWQLNYYAPGVGHVLTTLATSGGERRNTELLSYNLSGGHEAGEDKLGRSARVFKEKEKQ